MPILVQKNSDNSYLKKKPTRLSVHIRPIPPLSADKNESENYRLLLSSATLLTSFSMKARLFKAFW